MAVQCFNYKVCRPFLFIYDFARDDSIPIRIERKGKHFFISRRRVVRHGGLLAKLTNVHSWTRTIGGNTPNIGPLRLPKDNSNDIGTTTELNATCIAHSAELCLTAKTPPVNTLTSLFCIIFASMFRLETLSAMLTMPRIPSSAILTQSRHGLYSCPA